MNRVKELCNMNVMYQDILKFREDFTFGIELEFDKINLSLIRKILSEELRTWIAKSDITVTVNGVGGEIVSPRYSDDLIAYQEIMKACDILRSNNGVVNYKTATHVHVGAHILGEDVENWKRVFKMWYAFEEVILSFSKLDSSGIRSIAADYSAFYSLLKDRILKVLYSDNFMKDFCYLVDIGNEVYNYKYMALDFSKSDYINKYDTTDEVVKNKLRMRNTIEFRSMNGTFNPLYVQTGINFIGKLFEYALSDNFDSEIIDFYCKKMVNCKRFDINKALILSDLIYDNEMDKAALIKVCKGYDLETSRCLNKRLF